MRSEELHSGRGLAFAIGLAVAGLALAWLCVRTAMIGILSANALALTSIAPNAPNVVFGRALIVLGERMNILAKAPNSLTGLRDLDPATVAAVRDAAARAPLDARGFLILGYHQLATNEPNRAIQSLEAGQRLNPRDRLIHLLLLQQYLVSSRFAEAGQQFSVLSRLIGGAQPAIATVMAQMLVTPAMRDAARRTLRSDPGLERAVLIALAKGGSEPDVIFALASPTALNEMGDKDGWGQALVGRLVDTGRFQKARAVWRRVYKVPAAAAAAPIFNPLFRPLPASAPFNWTLIASGLGAADPKRDGLSIDYYGRDNGDLASQLLVLAPGRYRLAFEAEGGKADAASRLFWTVACARDGKTVLANVAVPTAPGAHRVAADFTAGPACSAQTLALRGEAGEFPSPNALTINRVVITPIGKTAS